MSDRPPKRIKGTNFFFNLLRFHIMPSVSPLDKLPDLPGFLKAIIKDHSEASSYLSAILERLDQYQDDHLLDDKTWNSTSRRDIKVDIQQLFAGLDSIVASQTAANKAVHGKLEFFTKHLTQVIDELAAEYSSLGQRTCACQVEMSQVKAEMNDMKSQMDEMKKDFKSRMDQMRRGFKYAMDVSVYTNSPTDSDE